MFFGSIVLYGVEEGGTYDITYWLFEYQIDFFN